MEQRIDETMAILTRTPAVLDALLRGLPDGWTRGHEGAGTWSAFDVVAHLIHCEDDDWMPRLRRILEDGEGRAFEPFDRAYGIAESQSRGMGELLDEFAQKRQANLEALRSLRLGQGEFVKRGLHPGLGTVTLGELLATWAAHDLNHLHQISRVMARQYREAVGPWRAYMGVMQCKGHGG